MGKDYLKEGFSNDQVREIQKGIEEGADISKYCDKEMLAACMRQIRFGLYSGIDVSVYAKKDYDWFQMEEIRLGLEEEIDVKEYANPDISYETMREVRLGLLENIDLYDYMGLHPKVLRQYRIGLEKGIDLMDYIEQGYDAEQLEQILVALSLNISKIGDFINTSMRGVCIAEITECLSKGIDASIVSKGQYNWQQMREIRLGLEHRINTRPYMNPWFDRNQMEQIRLGLEHGIDVSKYARLMYTSKDMNKMRLAIEYEGSEEEGTDIDNFDITKSYEQFDIKISRDEMSAEIVFLEAGLDIEYSPEEIIPVLAKRGVKKGIDKDALKKALAEKKPSESYLIAKGQKAKEGKNGYYEWFVRTDAAIAPTINEDESLNFKDIEWFETVECDEKLCEYHRAVYGTYGYTVTGRMLKPLPGKEALMLKGNGFVLGEDNVTYYANTSGKFELKDESCVEISEILNVKEVAASEKIKYKGSIRVYGDVKAGAEISATGDIIICGFAEGALLDAGGSITLLKGVNGGGLGLIRAAGNVQGKGFERIKVIAGGDIIANNVVSCELYSDKRIMIYGRQGAIEGGYAYATNGIIADNVGNKALVKTQLSVGINEEMMNLLENIEKQIEEVDTELEFFRNEYEELKLEYPPEIRNGMKVFIQTEEAIYSKEFQINELMKKASEQRKRIMEARLAKISVRRMIYEGVKLELCLISCEPVRREMVQFTLFKNEVVSEIYEESRL